MDLHRVQYNIMQLKSHSYFCMIKGTVSPETWCVMLLHSLWSNNTAIKDVRDRMTGTQSLYRFQNVLRDESQEFT